VREIQVLGIEGEHPFLDHYPIHVINDHHIEKRTSSPKVRDRPGLWKQESWHNYAKEAYEVHELVSETVRKGCEGSRRDLGTATVNLARILTECSRKAFKGIESAHVDKKEDWWDSYCKKARDIAVRFLRLCRSRRCNASSLMVARKGYRSLLNSKIRFSCVILSRVCSFTIYATTRMLQ
jgi:hypothetical protein